MKTIIFLNLFVLLSHAHTNPERVDISGPDGKVIGSLYERNQPTKELVMEIIGKGPIEALKCEETLISETSNSNGKFTVRVIEKNCGATVNFATHVEISGRIKKETIFILEGRPKVLATWKSDAELEVVHSKLTRSEIFKQSSSALGIRIHEQSSNERVGATDLKDIEKAYKYSTEGGREIFSVETMRRVAGWMQEASGLHRREWGHWNGSPPFGDDPYGQSLILATYKTVSKKPRNHQECRRQCNEMAKRGELKTGLNAEECTKLLCAK